MLSRNGDRRSGRTSEVIVVVVFFRGAARWMKVFGVLITLK